MTPRTIQYVELGARLTAETGVSVRSEGLLEETLGTFRVVRREPTSEPPSPWSSATMVGDPVRSPGGGPET
jgi:hypothetical protein